MAIDATLRLLRVLDGLGRSLRAAGLARFSRAGRDLLAYALPAGVSVDVEGVRLRGGILDRSFLYRVRDGVFEPATLRIFADAIQPGATVVDVGAYIGFYTVIAASRAGWAGTVIAVEPDPRSGSLLESNVRGLDNVRVVRKAVSDRPGWMMLYDNASDPSRASLVPRDGNRKGTTVECSTVDALVEGGPIDVVKIDVEGTEHLVLEGMVETLHRSPDPHLFVELNPTALREAGSSPEALVEMLRALGFQFIRSLDEERGSSGELLLCNLYCRRDLAVARG